MKLGCLPYLNVKPLTYTLEHGELPSGWELAYSVPSQLAKMLKSREIAAAPVSSFATFANPALQVCPEICIAADGPVTSVIMVSKTEDIRSIRSVALDTSSLSGANLLKILLDEAYGIQPEFISMPPHPTSNMLAACDAAMIIGDPAMQLQKDGLFVFDLAEEWKKLTGLPAVFAVWAGMDMTSELVQMLQKAKADSMGKLDEISAEESVRLGLPFDLCKDYLTDIIIYDMGEREQAGYNMFRQKCIEHKLVPDYWGGA